MALWKKDKDKGEAGKLIWQKLKGKHNIFRTKVPGGWLVIVAKEMGGGVTFYPDPNHEWDGSSLD